jgi:hypothetical protein
MTNHRATSRALSLLASLLYLASCPPAASQALAQQNQVLLSELQQAQQLTPEQMLRIQAIFSSSRILGQGNPSVSHHPMSAELCRERRAQAGIQDRNPEFERICGSPYMAPLYDPHRELPQDALACIDQYEFPDIPCTYPIVWVKAREAAELCEAEGKRLCDAHEWEDACQGTTEPPQYHFDLVDGAPIGTNVERLRRIHNRENAADKRWSYGPQPRDEVCATGSSKSPHCDGGNWATCGSNTYPTGSFPACRSPLNVYDQNGNVAEHMNLPMTPAQMSSRTGKALGYTEMKGSWFIFGSYRAHEDWCRWRAPYWHGSRVMDPNSHANYHLGFRCCKTRQSTDNQGATP